ncbi:MAG TPA: HTTM domain-containing protein [Pirellulaceae bacterium]|nr:HTTM domain-containing protein [Pirellulaceae bacterium]
MNKLVLETKQWLRDAWQSWDRFWFTPAEPHTLAAIRILGGAMLFYTHLVWGFNLEAFLGPQAWVDNATALELQRGWFTWSHLWYIESPALLWVAHIAALLVFALLTVGLFTRVMSVLACVLTLAYCHRLHGAMFGLDQVNAMLAMYLMLAPCGAVYSVDRWLQKLSGKNERPLPSVMSNIAIRLIQLHMCIIYLFGGISKLRGDMWWDGSAVWFAIANVEYQSVDLTWLAHFPWAIAALTHITVFWETFYCFTIWPKWSRPLTLAIAVAVHGGIALFLGMPTFGLAMLIGNLAFVSPQLVAAAVKLVLGGRSSDFAGAGEGERSASLKSKPASERKIRLATR